MNIRLKALKEMKEEILMKKSKIADEINDDEVACEVPVLFYNHNNIHRKILEEPIELIIDPQIPKKRKYEGEYIHPVIKKELVYNINLGRN
jgi:hypothetical protein